jgi:hypothetical protein
VDYFRFTTTVRPTVSNRAVVEAESEEIAVVD